MKYFKLSELTRTSKPIANVPNAEQESNLINLVEKVLDPARELLGKPITINSGFRCQEVNKAVGGASNSQHTTGEAADLSCSDNKQLLELIRSKLKFDQLINEQPLPNGTPSWVHVSYKRNGQNRGEVLMMKKDANGKSTYVRI